MRALVLPQLELYVEKACGKSAETSGKWVEISGKAFFRDMCFVSRPTVSYWVFRRSFNLQGYKYYEDIILNNMS